MKNITIILPIHKMDDDYKIMIENSVKSVENFYEDVKLFIVCPSTVKNFLSKIDFGQKLEIKYII